MLWANDSLYIVVNGGGVGGNGSGLYRVTDTNGDDQLDSIASLRKFKGGGEHGPHAVVLAPDGQSLFVLGGNHTAPPNPESSAVVPNYGEDQLLPRMPDARGHAASIRAPGGWIARTDLDGTSWELYSTGFRNQYDIAFNADGEMFTFDSDMEWDSGTPWYRPTRIYHCTSGSEFGWRTGTGKFPAWYPDVLPPAMDIGPGSPTGVLSGLGAAFPSKYQHAIYAFDWTYGTIYAIHLTPDGSSYRAEKEEFVTGIPLNITIVVGLICIGCIWTIVEMFGYAIPILIIKGIELKAVKNGISGRRTIDANRHIAAASGEDKGARCDHCRGQAESVGHPPERVLLDRDVRVTAGTAWPCAAVNL